jgi:small subunit ribosomal protein S18
MAQEIRRPRVRKEGGRFVPKPKVCAVCVGKVKCIDYKDVSKLSRYIFDNGRIATRRRSGACAKHQRYLAQAIKRARHLALLPYTASHVQETGGVGLREERPPMTPIVPQSAPVAQAPIPAVVPTPAAAPAPVQERQ